MNETIALIHKRLNDLKKSLESLQNNANAHIGAIRALEDLKKEIESSEKESSDATEKGIKQESY